MTHWAISAGAGDDLRSQKDDAFGAGGGTQLAVERGKRQAAPLGLQIGRIAKRRPVARGQLRSRPPSVTIRFRITTNGQEGKIGQWSIAKRGIMAAAPDTNLQNIGQLKAPIANCRAAK